jgi:3-(3-hydroxy-phenyl)propionate hydroxylase
VERLHTEVAIIGFGPVGAALTGLLGRRGIDVVVLESESDVYALPRAAHIDHQGLRLLQELGCVDDLLPDMRANPGMDYVNAARQLLARVSSNRPSASGFPSSMYFHQPGYDRAVRRTVSAWPTVRMFLETAAQRFEAGSQGAVVRAKRRSGGDVTVSARYVVACDGARSPVRTQLGMGLKDLDFREQWIVVDLMLKGEVPGLPDHAVNVCDPKRPHSVIPMPGTRYRFELMLMPGEDPERMRQPEVVAQLVSQWIPLGQAELERSAVYTFQGIVAREWRRGPFLLAGDAAHQMPPFLGQGMCSGLRDASNLAWKLGEILRNAAPDALLDTYQIEREPHVTEIVKAAVEFGRLVCVLDEEKARQRDAQMLANPAGLAGERGSFGLPSLGMGPLILEGGGGLFPQPTINGRRLDDLVGPRFLVLARSTTALDASAAWWKDCLKASVATLDQLPDATGMLKGYLDKKHADVVVVRPDRYVLAAGQSLADVTRRVKDLLCPSPAPVS